MRKPILTLTTDFGLSDHYVGVMKGVILGICPDAQIVDISHDVTAYAIAEGAFTIGQAYRHFPPGTVHTVVVDPGVGSPRRPILMEAAEQLFVAPDNGVLSMIDADRPAVRLLSNDAYFRHPVSRTFHGRDIFAPVAAHLANGVAPGKMGPILADYIREDYQTPRSNGPQNWSGRVLKVDRFGNLVTNFNQQQFGGIVSGNFCLTIGGTEIHLTSSTYAGSSSGELFVIGGSSGYLEVSLNQGSAAQRIGCQAGSPIELTIR
jgi:S-adenosylmethionine hydrolase